MSALLDNSIWHALSTRHAAFAQGGSRALRYRAAFAPMAATLDGSPESLAALAELIQASGTAALFTLEEMQVPAGLACVRRAAVDQMVLATEPAAGAMPDGTRALDAADVPAMLALVALTQPGPFAAETVKLGRYIGVFDGDALVAMAGERISPPGFVEISAVCTHPAYRGRGWAGALITSLARAATERGDTPFLHAFASNEAALGVYRRLGFVVRRRLHLAVVGLSQSKEPPPSGRGQGEGPAVGRL